MSPFTVLSASVHALYISIVQMWNGQLKTELRLCVTLSPVVSHSRNRIYIRVKLSCKNYESSPSGLPTFWPLLAFPVTCAHRLSGLHVPKPTNIESIFEPLYFLSSLNFFIILYCNPGQPGTHRLDQPDLKFPETQESVLFPSCGCPGSKHRLSISLGNKRLYPRSHLSCPLFPSALKPLCPDCLI